ncbi:MAG: HesA/MoeB/ThiF family protein [Planctomycetes bacterium]|nr:HesA/MoeB/ThiF family protein [Planctomycetota bacterium]
MDFSSEYLEQFSRHIRLPNFGREAQGKISRAKVLIAGAGGLGSPAMTYLAGAGVGKIGIADPDAVELSNLPRQIVHKRENIGKPKVESANERLKELNPKIEVEAFRQRLKADNIIKIITGYDVVIDGTDNFAAKYLINDACVIAGKPFIHGGVLRYGGQVMTILPKPQTLNPEPQAFKEETRSACYRCIFPEPPPVGAIMTCSEAGILNTVAGIGGLIQATEAIKLITGVGQLLINRLLVFDVLLMGFRIVDISPSDNCPACGDNPSIKTPADLARFECS